MQLRRLYTLVVGADPRQLEVPFALWTREMVRELIRRQFGIGLSVVSVGRLLHTLGLSARPLDRAYQQNPQAVQTWKAETYPGIRAEAEAAAATIYFADEAGSVRTTTPAPPGRRSGAPRWSRPPVPGSPST